MTLPTFRTLPDLPDTPDLDRKIPKQEGRMNVIDLFLDELEREGERTRRVLAQVPDDRADWKPHEKSMPFGYLSSLSANIFSWITMEINQDQLDINPPGKPQQQPKALNRAELLAALDKALDDARTALQKTSEAHLQTTWQLLFSGQVVQEHPRHVWIRETINHAAHHRGQMTVYLRLLGAKVPSLYGPSGDDRQDFGPS
jgi:uncharacterized damage-inducible protein DinB